MSHQRREQNEYIKQARNPLQITQKRNVSFFVSATCLVLMVLELDRRAHE